MSKRRAAVHQSGLMEGGETVLGDETAIFTVAPGRQVGGFVVQTDRAIYMCVQGALGLGKVKDVHRLAVADVFGPSLNYGGVSRESWDVGFVARRDNLTIGSVLDVSDARAAGLEDAKFVVVSFRSAVEGQRWSSLWDQAVRRDRGR